jgi:hypothetical protein
VAQERQSREAVERGPFRRGPVGIRRLTEPDPLKTGSPQRGRDRGGPRALAASTYGSPTARKGGDLDVLVRAEDVHRAVDLRAVLDILSDGAVPALVLKGVVTGPPGDPQACDEQPGQRRRPAVAVR